MLMWRFIHVKTVDIYIYIHTYTHIYIYIYIYYVLRSVSLKLKGTGKVDFCKFYKQMVDSKVRCHIYIYI